MAQYARPDATVSNSGWTAEGGPSTLHECVDEAAYSDSDYMRATSNQTCELGLSAITDPQSSSGHVLRWRAKATGTGAAETMTVTLKQGNTTIATAYSSSVTRTNFTAYSYSLTSGEADSISDYGDLRVYYSTTQGATETIDVSWIELEAPDMGGSTVEESATMARFQAASSGEILYADLSASLPRLAAVSIQESAAGQIEENLALDRIIRCAEPLAAATNETASAAIQKGLSAAEEIISSESLSLAKALSTALAENIAGEADSLLARTSGITAEDEGGAVTESVSLARSAAESQLSVLNTTGGVTAGRLIGISAQDDSGTASEGLTLGRQLVASAQYDQLGTEEAVNLSKSSLLAGAEVPLLHSQVPLGKTAAASAASETNLISLLGLARIMVIWAAGIRAGEEEHTYAPAERFYCVLSEPRVLMIASESRTTLIFADQRTCVIEDNRIQQIPAEERNYKVKR